MITATLNVPGSQILAQVRFSVRTILQKDLNSGNMRLCRLQRVQKSSLLTTKRLFLSAVVMWPLGSPVLCAHMPRTISAEAALSSVSFTNEMLKNSLSRSKEVTLLKSDFILMNVLATREWPKRKAAVENSLVMSGCFYKLEKKLRNDIKKETILHGWIFI